MTSYSFVPVYISRTIRRCVENKWINLINAENHKLKSHLRQDRSEKLDDSV